MFVALTQRDLSFFAGGELCAFRDGVPVKQVWCAGIKILVFVLFRRRVKHVLRDRKGGTQERGECYEEMEITEIETLPLRTIMLHRHFADKKYSHTFPCWVLDSSRGG